MVSLPALRVRGLRRSYGRGPGAVLANDGIDLDLDRGEVVGLLGPNGAGKSTAVRQIVGLLRPDSGSISMLGHDVVADPLIAARAAAYLPQGEAALAEMTVRIAVETTGALRGLSRGAAVAATNELLDELGLTDLASRPLMRLSGGQRRQAAVAATLIGSRPLLVLDEPTTGLDPEARRAVWAALNRRRERDGVSVLLITHNVIEAETVLDRVAVLDAGRVVAFDTPGRLKAAVSDQVRLELVWREAAPTEDPLVAALAGRATVAGRRWSLRLPADEAREVLGNVTSGPAFAHLDDFTLTTPSLEDVYLACGGQARDLERV